MAQVITIRGAKEAPKSQRSAMETLIFSLEDVNKWAVPPFQRAVRVNEKVRALAEEIKDNGGIIPGILTLGRLVNDRTYWIVDGQHRIEAFKISGLAECLTDARVMTFEDIADMAEEFVRLNSSLVKMRPDDVLRGLEGVLPALTIIRQHCPFVGYENIRRGIGATVMVSMSAVIRSWAGSGPDAPTSGGGGSAAQLAKDMTEESARDLVAFLNVVRTAWGTDPENYRLWSALNLTITMWLFRRLVLDRQRGVKRSVVLTIDEFRKCLLSVSASTDYVDWLLGRNMNDRDRSPCYTRLTSIFSARIKADRGGDERVLFPRPTWASGR